MKTFEIVVSLNNTKNQAQILTVTPHDNHENSYPTYFQLFKDGKAFAEIRLNDELSWEVCKGTELSPGDVQLIMNKIEGHVYKYAGEEERMASEVKKTEKAPAPTWFEKIVSSFSWKKSAA